MRSISLVMTQVAVLLGAASTLGATVFKIAVEQDGGRETLGLGVLVAAEHVVTSDAFVSQGGAVFVQHGPAGARIEAEVLVSDSVPDLALLAVPGLTGQPVTIAREVPSPGRFVYLQLPGGRRRDGAFLVAFKDKDQQDRFRFTARPEADETGAPLMNNCDQLLAISRIAQAGGDESKSAGGTSAALPELVEFLAESEVGPQTALEACPSLVEQRADALEAQRRLEEEKAALVREIGALSAAVAQGRAAGRRGLEELEAKRAQLATQLRKRETELAAKHAEAEATARSRAELEQQIRESERELRTNERELRAALVRERAARESASLLERILIFVLIAVAIGSLAMAVMAWRARRLGSNRPEPIAQASGEGPAHDPAPPPAGPAGRGRVNRAEPPSEQAQTSGMMEDAPPTLAVAGFRQGPTSEESTRLRETGSGAAQNSTSSEDPVVGWLVVIDGPGKGAEIALGDGRNSVGRGSGARARLDFGDTAVSRTAHAVVTYDRKGNRFYLQAGTGKNLAYVQDKPVLEPVQLAAGGEFNVGNTTLRFVPFCDESFSWSDAG